MIEIFLIDHFALELTERLQERNHVWVYSLIDDSRRRRVTLDDDGDGDRLANVWCRMRSVVEDRDDRTRKLLERVWERGGKPEFAADIDMERNSDTEIRNVNNETWHE